jgi:HNH endonuclease
MDDAVRARFMAKVRQDQSGCWVWTAASDGDGYGIFYLQGKNPRAHRVSLMLEGQELPDGMVVDHMCRNRGCVNPAHLRVVDRHTNVHENSLAPGHLNSLKTTCTRGHPLSGVNLVLDRGRRRCRECKSQGLRDLRLRKKGPQMSEHSKLLEVWQRIKAMFPKTLEQQQDELFERMDVVIAKLRAAALTKEPEKPGEAVWERVKRYESALGLIMIAEASTLRKIASDALDVPVMNTPEKPADKAVEPNIRVTFAAEYLTGYMQDEPEAARRKLKTLIDAALTNPGATT